MSSTLINNIYTHLGQPINIGFTGAVIPTLHRIVEKPVYGITIILVILGRINASLGGNGMGPSGTVLITEAFYVIAQFSHGGGSRGACQATAHHNHLILPFIGRVNQLQVEAVLIPFLSHRSGWYFGVQVHAI